MRTSGLQEREVDASRLPACGAPPCPQTLEEAGLDLIFVGDLVCKMLFLHGRMSLSAIAARVKFPVSLIESTLDFLRAERLCDIASRGDIASSVFVQLTEAGRSRAMDCMHRSQYAGPAPVPLSMYAKRINEQSVRARRFTQKMMAAGFAGIVMQDGVLDKIGAAMNSPRAMVIYGPPGSGKTYIAENLGRLLSDTVFVPHAIMVNDEIVEIYDPHAHEAVPEQAGGATHLGAAAKADARWVQCLRPVVFTGAELTLKALDLVFDDSIRYYRAPPHLMANNGLLVIDDLGRQLVSARELMNRWIVPLDRQRDYLTLHTGFKFEIPFDMIVVFSSNFTPADLADEAFLRRLGYKIHIGPLDEDRYRQVFMDVCKRLSIPFDEAALDYLLAEHHYREDRPLLACYPRDILEQVRDIALYRNQEPRLTQDAIDWAWNNYFTPGRTAAASRRASEPASATGRT